MENARWNLPGGWTLPPGTFELDACGTLFGECRAVQLNENILTFDCSGPQRMRVRIQIDVDSIENIREFPPIPEEISTVSIDEITREHQRVVGAVTEMRRAPHENEG